MRSNKHPNIICKFIGAIQREVVYLNSYNKDKVSADEWITLNNEILQSTVFDENHFAKGVSRKHTSCIKEKYQRC